MVDDIETKIAANLAAHASNQDSIFEIFANLMDSPIERLFASSLLAHWWHLPMASTTLTVMRWAQSLGATPSAGALLSPHADGGIAVFQARVFAGGHGYRLDFALVSEVAKVAIELDGHDFHERTKQQAAHDKSRDRRLTAAGWRVLRFTGSEVFSDANACVAQVDGIWQSLHVAGAR